jgi:serine/threonine kinase 38
MKEKNLSVQQKEELLQELAKKETEFIRLRRLRLTQNEFESIKIIGRGAFGEVKIPFFSFIYRIHASFNIKRSRQILKYSFSQTFL